MSRKRFSEREVLETLLHQGAIIRCYRCRTLIEPADMPRIEREHLHEIALGGPDAPANCRYSHKMCHAIITNGTKATSAGSSKHRIAKVKRILEGGRKRKGPPIKSRGFRKDLSKRMNGQVEKR